MNVVLILSKCAQLGTSEGKGPMHKNGTSNFFTIQPVEIAFQILKWRKYSGRFADIIALKTNDDYYVLE